MWGDCCYSGVQKFYKNYLSSDIIFYNLSKQPNFNTHEPSPLRQSILKTVVSDF